MTQNVDNHTLTDLSVFRFRNLRSDYVWCSSFRRIISSKTIHKKLLIWSRICILCKDQKDNHLFQFHCILSAHKNKHQNEFALSVDFFVDVNHFHFSERRSVRDKQNIETTNESQKTNNPAFSSIFTSQIQLWSEKKSTKMKEFYSIQVIVLTQVNDITWWLRGDQYYEELFRPISPSSIFCCKSENSVSLEILEVPSFWPFPGNA